MASKTARLVALHVIHRVLDESATLDRVLRDQLPELADARDRALAQRLAYGVLRWLAPLKFMLGQLLRRPLKPRDRDLEYALLLGLHQLWRESIAPHAAVNESVELARALGKPWAVALVNGVLRNFIRRRSALEARLGENPDVALSHPAWLLRRLREDWPDQWRELAHANNDPAPMWLRVNARRGDVARYADLLGADPGMLRTCPFARDALGLAQARPVTDLPGFADGLVSVQDPAAQLAADLLELEPGQSVLDACAAPGGKTAHILEREPELGRLLALDASESRLRLLRDNLDRLGLVCEVRCGDAGSPGDWWGGEPFDRILIDAPCSASGVIRRHPDIKWLRSEAAVEALSGQQASLLAALWPTLKPGGTLVYATCSVLSSENQFVVAAFLEDRADAQSLPLEAPWGLERGPGRQLLPHRDGTDGFYYARIRKSA